MQTSYNYKSNMEYMVLFYIFILIWLLPFSFGVVEATQEKTLLNWCLDGKHHKLLPGPEDQLHSQCKPWKNRSCCTHNTTRSLHTPGHYNFNFDHCKNLSTKCREHFIQDLCFYECTPNAGPWIVKVEMKIRKEKYYKIPLCASDCESWFNACKNDFTCTDNWIRNFVWNSGSNKCIDQTACQTFQYVFHNATNFCQKVWDHSWEVVPDNEYCMRIWFDGEEGNPNDKVAKYYADKLQKSATNFASWSVLNTSTLSFHLLLLLIFNK